MKSLGNLSAKAIRKIMLLAIIKAEKHKEKHDEFGGRYHCGVGETVDNISLHTLGVFNLFTQPILSTVASKALLAGKWNADPIQ